MGPQNSVIQCTECNLSTNWNDLPDIQPERLLIRSANVFFSIALEKNLQSLSVYMKHLVLAEINCTVYNSMGII